MKIVFFGTPGIAVPFLNALHADGEIELLAVVCQPDRPSGRGRTLEAPPVKVAAEAAGIPVHQFATLKDASAAETLKRLGADAFVVFAYGKIIPQAILDLPRFGCVNVHPSLLPLYRGPSPIQAPILNGDAETGITIMKMDAGMDTGPILAQEHVGLDVTETSETLSQKIMAQGPELLVSTLKRYAAGEIQPIAQDDGRATITKLIDKDDGRAIWTHSAIQLERMVRAYHGWPSVWCIWDRTGKEMRLKIHEATNHAAQTGEPGTVTIVAGALMVACGEGSLEITRIQPEGKAAMTAAAFLAGYSDIGSARLA